MLALRLLAASLVLAALAGAERGRAPAVIRLAELAAHERGIAPSATCADPNLAEYVPPSGRIGLVDEALAAA